MKEYILREIGDPETLAQEVIVGELIRCKDCKYRLHLQATEHYPETYICRCDNIFGTRKANDPEWFCGDGKRREE